MAIEGEEGDASYRVRVAGESGKVDINSVPEDDLLEILKKGGLPDGGGGKSCGTPSSTGRTRTTTRGPGARRSPSTRGFGSRCGRGTGTCAASGSSGTSMGVTQEFYDRFLSRVFTVHGDSSRR